MFLNKILKSIMGHDQIENGTIIDKKTDKNENRKMRSAIDLLLSSDAVEVLNPTVKLTECSSNIDVIINKQGGICTKCNRMFKSKVSLIGHLEKCSPDALNMFDTNNEVIKVKPAKMIIVSQ